MNEIWKPVSGYEGRYEVSNLGRVKSLNYLHNTGREHILKPRKTKSNKKTKNNKKSYMRVTLCDKQHLVHILVYRAFYGEIPEGMQVNHINKNPSDNRADNLNLMTPAENIEYSLNKPISCYDKNGNLIRNFSSVKEASDYFGYGRKGCSNISKCLNGSSKTAYKYKWCYN